MKIVIYGQDEVIVKAYCLELKGDIIRMYGEKIGDEAIEWLKTAQLNHTFRKLGGPLIKVVSEDEAIWIRTKEKEIEQVA